MSESSNISCETELLAVHIKTEPDINDIKVESSYGLESKVKVECTEIDIKEDETVPSYFDSYDKLVEPEIRLEIGDDLKMRTGTENIVFSCGISNKCFRTEVIHSGNKRYICEICNRSYGRKSDLKCHQRIHAGAGGHSCEVCGKSFARKSHLINHRLIHSEIKPYSCEICGTYFREKGHVKRHKLTHSGNKSYSCEICNRSFVSKRYLSSHFLVHSGSKQYTCEVCNKSFVRKPDLTRHKHLHSEEKPYTCEICSKCFVRKSYLADHLRSKHSKPDMSMNCYFE